MLGTNADIAAVDDTAWSPHAGRAPGGVRVTIRGVGYGPQRSALVSGANTVVACPGRLEDLMATGDIVLDRVEVAVVDEADRMADMGFLPEVKRLLDAVRPDRQTLLFSATLDGSVGALIDRYQTEPVTKEVMSETVTVEQMHHRFLKVHEMDKAKVAAHGRIPRGGTEVTTFVTAAAGNLV